MEAIFINSENSKTSYPHRPMLNLTGEINLWKSDRICSKIHSETTNVKYHPQHGMINLNINYLIDDIFCIKC